MKKSTLLAGLIVCATLLSCKKNNSSLNSNHAVNVGNYGSGNYSNGPHIVTYKLTGTNCTSLGGSYPGLNGYSVYFNSTKDTSISITISPTYAADLYFRGDNSSTTPVYPIAVGSIYVDGKLVAIDSSDRETGLGTDINSQVGEANYLINLN